MKKPRKNAKKDMLPIEGTDYSLKKSDKLGRSVQWFSPEEREKVQIWLFAQLNRFVSAANRAKQSTTQEGGEVFYGQLAYWQQACKAVEGLLHIAGRGINKHDLAATLALWQEHREHYQLKLPRT